MEEALPLEVVKVEVKMEEEESDSEYDDSSPDEKKIKLEEEEMDVELPAKSKLKYEAGYQAFLDWKKLNNKEDFSEPVLLDYFEELSKKYAPSTLWGHYSMLNKTLKINEGNIDISYYKKLKLFLKNKSKGYQPKKGDTLSPKQIIEFLENAPEDKYLAMKVALIFGICGACRSYEMLNIKAQDVTEQGELLLVTIPSIKESNPRRFVVTEEFTETVKKYRDLRPKNATTDRFFLQFRNGKCTAQVIGIHQFGGLAKQIASFLGLENPKNYCAHALRFTSASLVGDSVIETHRRISHKYKKKRKTPIQIETQTQDPLSVISNEEVILPSSLAIDSLLGGNNNSNPEKSVALSGNTPIIFNNCTIVIKRD